MAINENLEYIKQGLSTQEQILGQAIAGERFFKKHKKGIYSTIIIIVLAIVAFSANDFIKQKNLEANNALYIKLLSEPSNQNLINELESKNINLFALFALSNFNKTNNEELLNRAIAKVQNAELKEILLAAKGENSSILQDYNALKNGFEALKNNEFDKAKLEFSKIPENSNLKIISKNLQHYQGIKE